MKLEELSAGDLAVQAAKGDQGAFRALFEQFHGRVYRYVLARLGMEDQAQDAAQEVFLGAWRSIGSFRNEHEASFAGWLFGIASHVVGSQRRRNAKESLLDLQGEPEDTYEGGRERAEFEGQVLDRRLLFEALGSLPELQREVVMMRFIAGLTAREVGQSLGKTEGAVTAAQMRGLKRLRRKLEGQ